MDKGVGGGVKMVGVGAEIVTGDGDREIQKGVGGVRDDQHNFEVGVKGVSKVDEVFKLLMGARSSTDTVIHVAEEEYIQSLQKWFSLRILSSMLAHMHRHLLSLQSALSHSEALFPKPLLFFILRRIYTFNQHFFSTQLVIKDYPNRIHELILNSPGASNHTVTSAAPPDATVNVTSTKADNITSTDDADNATSAVDNVASNTTAADNVASATTENAASAAEVTENAVSAADPLPSIYFLAPFLFPIPDEGYFMGSRVNVEDCQGNSVLTVPPSLLGLSYRWDSMDDDCGIWDIVCK
eukprot:g46443.t1